MADDEPIDLTAGVALADIPEDGLLGGVVGEQKVMLARWTDDAGRPQVSALAAECTHRGAPLTNGLRTGDSVVCPFHHACFDLRSGEATSAPAIDPLDLYEVTVDGDRVTVSSAAPAPGTPERVDNSRGVERVVVLGGGAAGFAAVERLRRVGYDGTIALVSASDALPIDRTELSKNYLSGAKSADDLPLEPAEWYASNAIDTHLGVAATALDLAERAVSLSDGTELSYDALVLATGSEPTRPELPGFDRDDAYVLRVLADADAIVEASEGKRVLVLGDGFIALECAAALRQREVDVTVVMKDELPMTSAFGADLGGVIRALHEENGTRFVRGTATGWTGSELQLEEGEPVPGDVLVLGLGVTPATGLAADAGLEVDDGVVVDQYGETAVQGVFAAGDIARFPDPVTGELIRVEHWAVAERAGALAAVNLLGGAQPLTEPPFFWSMQFGKSFRMVGHPSSTEDGASEGSAADQSLLVRFLDGERLTAAAGIGKDPDLLRIENDDLRQAEVLGS